MSWATDRVHQDLSSTGKYNANLPAKEYAGLEEDGGSRVDDGAGGVVNADSPPKNAVEYA